VRRPDNRCRGRLRRGRGKFLSVFLRAWASSQVSGSMIRSSGASVTSRSDGGFGRACRRPVAGSFTNVCRL
jgi:hypothetical protein